MNRNGAVESWLKTPGARAQPPPRAARRRTVRKTPQPIRFAAGGGSCPFPARVIQAVFPASRLVGALLALGAAAWAQSPADYEQPPVSYSATAPLDAVARLQPRLAAGELKAAGTDRQILLALLAELKVPVASQVVVFSKTSLQRGRIRPDHPRALYFSDTVYVGWVPGGLIEITTIDPQLGPIFYSFDPRAVRAGGAPKFARDPDCLRCHGGAFVRDVPGVFARSVFPDADGEPLLRHGSQVVDDRTPFEERWGGWYVTGYTGQLDHRGNAIASESSDQLVFSPAAARPQELSGFFDTAKYPAATSDVVALLVLEHQMTVQNSLTRAGHACRKMLAYQRALQESFREPVTAEPVYASVKSVFASAERDVVDRLLFRHEAPLPDGVVGSEAFRRAFAASAPRSAAGRALKDLALRERIFAHRCSYLIYGDSFRALPDPLKTRVLDRLHAVLTGRDTDDRYAYLPPEEKRRILEILRETHPDARARWREPAAPARNPGGSGS